MDMGCAMVDYLVIFLQAEIPFHLSAVHGVRFPGIW